MAILIGYDGRQISDKALDYAIRHSVAFREKLYIVGIINRELAMTDEGVNTVRNYMSVALERAKAGGADAESVIESGQPDRAILDCAGRFNCDTIVVGRSGRTNLNRAIMGSVSNAVLANAKGTVILIQ